MGVCKCMGMKKYLLAFGYAKFFHGYVMRRGRSMRVDVGVPYTGLMVDMEMMMSYTDSEIETGRNSLRMWITIDMDIMISYSVSEIETGWNFFRIVA